jgi:hypothetical protein
MVNGLRRIALGMMIACISMEGLHVSAQDEAPKPPDNRKDGYRPVSYTHLRAHET